MLKETSYLTHSYSLADGHKLPAYEAAGGYRGVKKALGMFYVEKAKAALRRPVVPPPKPPT